MVVTLGDDGTVTSVGRRVRTDAHKLIEEYMISANEAVARYTHARKIPSLYRTHDAPDVSSVQGLKAFLAGYGYMVPG